MTKEKRTYKIVKPTEITGKRRKNGKLEYLVKWDDNLTDNTFLLETWEPEIHLRKCQSMI